MRSRQPPIEKLFSVEEIFPIMMHEEYRADGETVVLKRGDMSLLLRMISQFAVAVKERIALLEGHESEKYKAEREKWQEHGQRYNQQVLSQVKDILYEKMTDDLRREYLGLIREIILPCSVAFKKEVEFIFDTLLKVFEQ